MKMEEYIKNWLFEIQMKDHHTASDKAVIYEFEKLLNLEEKL